MNNNKKRIIIASGLTIVMGITGILANAKLSKKNSYDGLTSNISYSNDVDYISLNDSFDEIDTLEAFQTRLNDIIETKNFDTNISNHLNSVLNKLYNNYDAIQEVYSDENILTKEQFIDNFLNTITENINEITIVNETDTALKEELFNAKGRYFVNENKILIDSSLEDEDFDSTLLHEIIHSSQKEVYNSFVDNFGLSYVFTEGEAAFSSTYLNNTINFNSRLLFESSGFNYYITGAASTENALYSKYYCMLGNLIGFDKLESCKDNYDITKLEDLISSNCNINGKDFLSSISKTSETIHNNYLSTNIDDICKIENIYTRCLKEKINNIDSKEEAINALNNYRHYKLQYSIECFDSEYNDVDKFNYSDVENVLYQKIIEYNILPENIERETFDVLLCNINFDGMTAGKEVTISNIRYSMDENSLIFTSRNNNISEIYSFDTKELKTINNDNQDVFDNSNVLISNENIKKK